MLFSGEQFQELCNVYIGDIADFAFNPRIAAQAHKCLALADIPATYYNPPLVFCYAHQVRRLGAVLDRFQRSFILISHNSDTNIDETYHDIADHKRVFHWFAQNLCTQHPKISWLPIGVANEQWPHGRRDLFVAAKPAEKCAGLYFQFGPSNPEERNQCAQALSRYYQFQPAVQPANYLKALAAHRFTVSPAGAGADCHRTWEALHCGCIPILRDSTFSRQVAKDFPVLIVDSWTQVTPEFIANRYSHVPELDMSIFKDRIVEKAKQLLEFAKVECHHRPKH